jgi:DNA-binding GntR family transcriptional regulator
MTQLETDGFDPLQNGPEALGERLRPNTAQSAPAGKAGDIADELERRLMLGAYRFGEPLSIIQLARQFGASRQPVSVAISHLRSIGYVDIIPQVGCRVVSPTQAQISDFFLAMGKMEGVVAGFAAQRYVGEEARVLLAITGRAGPRQLESAAGRIDYIRAVNDFHEQIWRMARSPTLEGRIARLRKLSIFYLWQGAPRMAPVAAQQLNRERANVAEAIAAREVQKAEQLMESHIAHKPSVSGVV